MAVAPIPWGGRAGPVPRPLRRAAEAGGAVAGPSLIVTYLSLVVLLPMAALVARAFSGGGRAFWQAVTQPETAAALRLTLMSAAVVVAVNTLVGTALAWLLVRDDGLPGRRLVGALIDLPFALPTVVAGVVLLGLYGPHSPVGLHVAFTRTGIALALAFVTLPFSVRSVQPVLAALDGEAEEAAASLGAGPFTVFRRIVLPALAPAVLSGAALAFARAVGEYGSVVIISGNLPFRSEVASVRVFGLVQSSALPEAAAASVVLLGIALVVMIGAGLMRRRLLRGEPA